MSYQENSPLLRKQSTLATVGENHHHGVNVLAVIWLAPAIAALVIASEYNESVSPCRFGSYTVGLREFLLYAGGIHLGHFILHTCSSICSICFCNDNDDYRDKHKSHGSGFACLIGLFDIVWAIIGCHMYSQQMDYQCQQTDIAKMILAWSIIKLGLFGFACCCMSCVLCCACICGES